MNWLDQFFDPDTEDDTPVYRSFTVEVPSRPEPKQALDNAQGFIEGGNFYRNDGHIKSYGTLC